MQKKKVLHGCFLLSSILLFHCSSGDTIQKKIKFVDITTPEDHIEASGVIEYNNQFIIISDDTKKDVPYLFIFNTDGKFISKKMVTGVAQVEDFEGISRDSYGNIFITSSLDKNKKKRAGFYMLDSNFTVIKSVNLRNILQNSGNLWISDVVKSNAIDIEGTAVIDSTHYFGLKSPLDDTMNSVIIQVKNIFSNTPKVDIFAQLKTGGGITALDTYKNSLIAVSKKKDKSSIWSVNIDSRQLTILKEIDVKRVEGITTFNENYVLVKDGNEKISKFLFLNLSDTFQTK